MIESAVRGMLLLPSRDGRVAVIEDGLLVIDRSGVLSYAGAYAQSAGHASLAPRAADGVILPPLLDIHTHISQYGIRGHFTDGVPDDAPQGKLLAGLERNVFPTEMNCADEQVAYETAAAFLKDTLSHGVVGGAAYMTSSPVATRVALEVLPETWRVGMVLMNQQCPSGLRTDAVAAERDVRALAERFGPRLIVTDRFAVACDSALRRSQAALAGELGLRTQTHLNEQVAEKRFVEQTLYPDYAGYTDVYLRDGLLDHRCILAHCIYMTAAEWQIVADTGSVVAHCPTSNLLLGSGVMPLEEVVGRSLPYALATDVGASPTVSMLAEMRRFLQVHHGESSAATACEALYRSTLAPAELLDFGDRLGTLAEGRPASFLEVQPIEPIQETDAESIVRALLPQAPDRPVTNIERVTLAGRTVFERHA